MFKGFCCANRMNHKVAIYLVSVSILLLIYLVFRINFETTHYVWESQVGNEEWDLDSAFHDAQQKGIMNTCYDPTGRPKKSVYLLKVYKTGSTTTKNILQRIVLKYNLTLPITKTRDSFPKRSITEGLIPFKTYWNIYTGKSQEDPRQFKDSNERTIQLAIRENQIDVYPHHSIYVKEDILKIMPNDVTFIATLRHPLKQMISAFDQFNLAERFNILRFGDPVKEFLTNPEKYDVSKVKLNITYSNTNNFQAYQFGFDMKKLDDPDYVDNYLNHLNETFRVVILTERFMESLIFLKREMCWSFQDILFLHLRNTHRTSVIYGDELLENHRKWTYIDYKLYEMFLNRHENLILQGGKLYEYELKAFSNVIEKVTKFCYKLQPLIDNKNPETWHNVAHMELPVGKSPYNEGFKVTGADCIILGTNVNSLGKAAQIQKNPELCDMNFVKTFALPTFAGEETKTFCNTAKKPMIYNLPYSMARYAFWKA